MNGKTISDDKETTMTTETTQEATTRYRQKSANVEARQLIDNLRNHTSIVAWVESAGGQAGIPFAEPCLYIETADGRKRAGIGDWIVRFPAGTFQVIPPGKFDAAFESALEADEAEAEHFARDVSLAAGARMLGRIVVKQARTFEAARIEMLQSGPEKAMQWILNSIPDVSDEDPGLQWDGHESAAAWLDRVEAADGAAEAAAK